MKVLTFLVFISLIFSQIFATPFPLLAETTNISPASGLLLTDIKISLDLKGIDIIEALKIISSKGNLNMVVGGNIQGRVTLFLKDVGIQDALEIMLVSNNLAYDKRGDIFYIMTQNEYQRIYGENFGGKKEVRVMPLKHAKASDISRSLEQAKTQLGKIIVDDASNTLVLIDSPSTLVEMQDIVTQLDQPTLHRVFELKYAKVADLEAKITPLLSQGVGTLQADERTNKIAVTDTSSKIEAIGKIIRAAPGFN
jgi:type II secretory pathway component GspD/PulD (secretin)